MSTHDYKELIDLGFNREDYTDNVHFNKYGWSPFHLTYDLTKRIYLEYNCEDKTVGMYRVDKEFNIKGNILNLSLSSIKQIIKFYKS